MIETLQSHQYLHNYKQFDSQNYNLVVNKLISSWYLFQNLYLPVQSRLLACTKEVYFLRPLLNFALKKSFSKTKGAPRDAIGFLNQSWNLL